MGKHMNWLAERGVQCVSSTMLAQGGKYDNYHLHDHQFNSSARGNLTAPQVHGDYYDQA
jgi:hypothetical protein